MQAVLNFPFIRVPPSAALTRCLLYWDQVGTIVPESWSWHPESLGPYTQELVQRGLVRQVFPHEASHRMGFLFEEWLRRLDASDLAQRRERFEAGDVMSIHIDKWIWLESGFAAVKELALGRRARDWYEVESKTGSDFMAALALALCLPESFLQDGTCRWVPATEDALALDSLLSGLTLVGEDTAGESDLQLRVGGAVQTSQLRTSFLEGALPVPDETISPAELELFRRRHADKLPACRRHVEAILDANLGLSDEALRFRALERMQEEVEDLTSEAEAYLREAGMRRLYRSPFLRLLKCVPVISGAVTAGIEAAGTLATAEHFEAEPLAYLAIARADLKLSAHYHKSTGTAPLAEVFGR